MSDALISLVVASALLLGSPGPAPLSLAATGAGFGFRRGVPFLLGILAGLAVSIALGAAGLTTLFAASPSSRLTMQILGGAYICYLAIRIATAPIERTEQLPGAGEPAFRDGLIINLLNPKAYAIFPALFSYYLLPLASNIVSVVATALTVFGVAIVIDIVWLALGGLLRPVLDAPGLGRITRVAFGLMMVASLLLAYR